MVWGCMTYYGVGDACWIPGKINSEIYIDVLQGNVLASRDYYNIDPSNFIFQQDNASVHTAKIVKDYIGKSKMTVMEWPANSPDLSPIESLWTYPKRALDRNPKAPESMDELWEQIQDAWVDIDIEKIHKLYEGMHHRMKLVIQNKGGPIKY